MQPTAKLSEMNSIQIATFLFSLILNVEVLPFTGAALLAANEADHLALLAIKSKIVQDPQGVTRSWNDSFHYCQWQGVTCGHRHKRVTVLNLSTRGLVGSLSPFVGNLSFLREIQLQNNTLGGGIPQELGRLSRLQYLYLQNNSFEGEIPANISQCANLSLLHLGYNKLVGIIPKEFSSLLMLKEISIRNNNLSGEIPPFIGNLTSLETINLGYCHFMGSIPNVFHKLRILRVLRFPGNHLIGSIPSSIYNLSLLESLSVAGNQLNGSLPASFPLKLHHVQVLALELNDFTGSVPPSISNCSKLEILDFSSNSFSGEISINFGNLQNLRVVCFGGNKLVSGEHDEMRFLDTLSNCSNLSALDISYNKFAGMLPNSLGNFSTQLEFLWLGTNHFYGSLPSSIGSLVNLMSLNLSENHFTGTVPYTIGKLMKLQKLNLDRNRFSGKIPNSIGNLSLLIQLGMGSNKLEGTIPLSLGNCHNLQFLSLYDNSLSGSIPKQIFELSLLSIVLNLGRNNLSGPLSFDVGSLKNLGQLVVAENRLSGELPSSLGSCTSLELLDLSSNSFHGSIPASFGSLALRFLNLSYNNFSGLIPRIFKEKSLENGLDISFNNFEGEVPVIGVFANSSELSVVGNPRLCGGMPALQLPKCSLNGSKKQHKLSVALKIVISVAPIMLAVAGTVSFFLFCWRKMKRKDQPSGSELKNSFLKVSYERLLKATNGFSSENLIGFGAFASVYKGILNEEGVIIAVKVLNLQHRGGLKSFIRECEALTHVRHRNLLKVITSCSSVDSKGNEFKALIYEYMPNGTLEWWLHSRSRTADELPQLTLLQRVCIAIDVACAIDYLHHHLDNPIIHCDLKPSNILLDKDMVAHVGDFGLAKFLLPEQSNVSSSSTTGIIGTLGYAPPEYGLGNDVSKNGDVYSYGIVLLEMVTGKKPTDPLFHDDLNIQNWVRMALAKDNMEIVGPFLLNEKKKECLISVLKIGVACSLESEQARMDINLAIHELQLLRDTILSE